MQPLLVAKVDSLQIVGVPLRDEEMSLMAVCQRDRKSVPFSGPSVVVIVSE